MNIIDMILVVWLIGVALLVSFMIGDRIAWYRPKTKFAKWWRNNMVMHLHQDDEQF